MLSLAYGFSTSMFIVNTLEPDAEEVALISTHTVYVKLYMVVNEGDHDVGSVPKSVHFSVTSCVV